MKLVMYTADCICNAENCNYPNRVEALSPGALAEAVQWDHVAAKFKNSYRGNENFEEAVLLEMDCDNDHSENPDDWLTPEQLAEDEDLRDVEFATTPSRNNMRQKGEKSPRPRFHFHAPIEKCADPIRYAAMKRALQRKYPFFDINALDASRFMYASRITEKDAFWHEGFLTVDEILDLSEAAPPMYIGTSIFEGKRNNTMSHFAGRVLKKYGVSDKAHELFLKRSQDCDPPLPDSELNTIWNSALKFYQRVQQEDGYIPPKEYNDDFGTLKPEDYSDIGEAKVLAFHCNGFLKFTSGTDYLAFCGDCWHEDKQKSLDVVEEFLDTQLADAQNAVTAAEDALVALGIEREVVKKGGKKLEKEIPGRDLGLLYALMGAKSYLTFVMKYRNYKNIINTMNAARPMFAMDVSELDYDPGHHKDLQTFSYG